MTVPFPKVRIGSAEAGSATGKGMTGRSLRLRLGLAAAGLIALALALAGLGLLVIFDSVLDARTLEDLDRTAKLLAGEVQRSGAALSLGTEPRDARFATPYGGLYWQIATPDGPALASRSLWDKRLPVATPPDAEPHAASPAGPDGGRLIALSRRVAIGRSGEQVPVTITVAMDRRQLEASRARYLALIVPSLLVLGLVLAGAMSLFVARALGPFRDLRADLARIHDGRARTLARAYPDEVQPLVDDLNRLIEVQERAVERSRTQAGDMAHGLKTPLAVLAALARGTEGAEPTTARAIEEQTRAMQAQVERALARARIVAAGALRRRSTPVEPVVAQLVTALRRLPEADSLVWEIAVAPDLGFPAEAGELTELLGNLLDNARQWAHRRVRIAASVEAASRTALTIEDDGPGMSAEAIAGIARGRRWDESKPGTGFGLAIAGDLAAEIGVRFELDRSPLGGLRARLTWTPNARMPG